MTPLADPSQRRRVSVGMALALLVAGWPVLVWWARRTVDDSDEPLGVLALVVALGFIWQGRGQWRMSEGSLAVGLALVVTARLLTGELPMLALGLLLIAALVGALRLWRRPGVVGLLSLSLPWVATVEFLLGYPLRVLVAVVAAVLLDGAGVEVTREGTDLWHQGKAVGVDAPCSGLRLLWFLLFAAMVLAARFRLNWQRTGLIGALGLVLALVANTLRATVLFFPESGLVTWPHWTHEATGLLFFAPALIVLLSVARRWEMAEGREAGRVTGESARVRPVWLAVGGLLAMVLALSWAWRTESGAVQRSTTSPVNWPHQFRGVALSPLPLSLREEHFAAGFPGALARFRCGEGEVIFRRVDRATRKLHAAEDCFKAAGYAMRRLTASAMAEEGLWQVWEAQRGDEPPLWVAEQIRSADGDLFTDVSAWYWQALRHPETGPWTAVTWVRPADPSGK